MQNQDRSQAEAIPRPSFEVASVKLNSSGALGGGRRAVPGGRLEITNQNLQAIIRYAYDVRAFQIAGDLRWLNADRFDIVAKANGSVSASQTKAMLQTLLAERFKLSLHWETKELPVYALVVGKNGPKFHEVTSEGDQTASSGTGEISDRRVPISVLINQLSGALDRVVRDRTGLTGSYDVTLTWTPEQNQSSRLSDAEDAQGRVQNDPIRPPLIFAVQEQLGLRLNAERGPVEVFVVDHIERIPTAN